MASEAEASCESDPNFAIICAFMDKFGESCGIPSIDFIELQQMLENNQEVSPELMNLHIKLLRKTKKNVTVERWERALINMCHTFSSKDAWEIERFGYKKTRLSIKIRALKELLEMQFDFNTKFKNEVNKMTAEELRSQPLGRDKLGRSYWFQTDNNYQIRIYKEDPDEETWNLIAKDRDGLLSLITELSDGDSKLSSDSACNEDSNSLLEKPFVDTGQTENSVESKMKEETAQKDDERLTSETNSNFDLPSEKPKSESDNESDLNKTKYDSEIKSVIPEQEPTQKSVEELNEDDGVKPKKEESTEIRRPMLRIKSLSELMEKPKEPPRANFLPDLPELTIIKKPKIDLPEITIVKRPRMQQPSRMRAPQVSSAVKSPLMIIRGNGSGRENKCGNSMIEKPVAEPVLFSSGRGLGRDCEKGNQRDFFNRKKEKKEESISKKVCDEFFIGDEIEEPVMYFNGRGTGVDCETGNEKNSSKVDTDNAKLRKSSSCRTGNRRDCLNKVMENKQESVSDKECDDLFIGDEIEEPVMYFCGRGIGIDCETGNEKDSSNVHTDDEKLKSSSACSLTPSQTDTGEIAKQVPTSNLSNIKLGTVIDSKTDSRSFLPRSQNKKTRWDQKESQGSEIEEKTENSLSTKKMTFFFGPGSLNVKPSPALNSSSGELEHEYSERKDVISDEKLDNTIQTSIQKKYLDRLPNEDDEVPEHNELPLVSGSIEENTPTNINNERNSDSKDSQTIPRVSVIEEKENIKNINMCMEEQVAVTSTNTDKEPEHTAVHLESDTEDGLEKNCVVAPEDNKEEKLQNELEKYKQEENLQNECKQDTHDEEIECLEDKIKEKLEKEYSEDTSRKKLTNEIKDNEKSQNETKLEDTQNTVENIEDISQELEQVTDSSSNKGTECIQHDIKTREHETEENFPESVASAGDTCNEASLHEVSEINEKLYCSSQASDAFSKEITYPSKEETREEFKPSDCENMKGQNVLESTDDSLLKSCPTDEITTQETSENLVSCSDTEDDINPTSPTDKLEEANQESSDDNLNESFSDNEKILENQNEVGEDNKKTELDKIFEEEKPENTSADHNVFDSRLDCEKLSKNKNEVGGNDKKTELIKVSEEEKSSEKTVPANDSLLDSEKLSKTQNEVIGDDKKTEPSKIPEEAKPSEKSISVDGNVVDSLLDCEKLSKTQNEPRDDDRKTVPNELSEEAEPLEQTACADSNLDENLLDNEMLLKNQIEVTKHNNKAEDATASDTQGQETKIAVNDNNVPISKKKIIIEKNEKLNSSKKVEEETVKRGDKEDSSIKSEENSKVIVEKIIGDTEDKFLKRGRTTELRSKAVVNSKKIEIIKKSLKEADKKEQQIESKANVEDVPPGKKRRGRKITPESKKIISEDILSDPVGLTSIRPVRQTRQTRSCLVEAPLIQPTKGRGRRRAPPQTTKSDETGSTDSPIPLESVTVNDVDSNSAAADNTETDPLAVSDDDIENGGQAVSSITSFSFDYDPNSPASQSVAVGKKNLRKRGRESFESKPEAGETIGKKPKIKGKRTADLTLRKSVEEKRQKEVGDASSDENESTESPTKKETKAKKRGSPKKNAATPPVSDSDNAAQKLNAQKNMSKKRNARLLKNLGVREEDISALAESPSPVRQSRRLAQIKIKEDAVTRRKIEEDDVTHTRKKKKKKEDDKDFKGGKRKRIEEEVKPAPSPPMVEKKKRKKKKHNKISIGWNTSSEDSENSYKEEEVSEYEYEEPHEEEPLQFKSDHEFSPESDLEGDEQLPHKRARTARKEESDDADAEEEFLCQKCGKSDHPEWILLCDKCDNGWHCSCLRPALFVIPEGDWFCPTCQHEKLLEKLHERLVEFDKLLVKKGMEDRRKERLAYVGISLNNVLPAKDKKEKKLHQSSGSSLGASESESGSESADTSDSDEPIYQLRQRRQAHSYKFQDYDDLINSALQEEPPVQIEKTHTLGRGKDIATIVNAAKEEEERNPEKNGFEDLPPVVPKDSIDSKKKALSYRKKPKRLNNLEVNSDDEADDSDEDFKGSSSDESEEEDFEEDSEDSFVGRKSSRPVRRSTRARTTRFDADFINDDDSDDAARKKKKKKVFFDDSESEQSDDWRGGRKKQRKISPYKKSKKMKKRFDDSDLETYRKKKPKIKYGMESDDDTRGRRTRGKRTSYLDTLGSDSEEEALKKKLKDKSEDEEYIAEDDDKESEDEFDAENDKNSEEGNGTKEGRKADLDDNNSNSEEDGPLVINKLKFKNKRAIIDSDDEDENSAEIPEKIDNDNVDNTESAKVNEPMTDKAEEEIEPDKPDEIIAEKNIEIVPEVNDEIIPVKDVEIVHEKSTEIMQLEKKALEKPPSVVVPMLNVEKLKACGITLTKVSKEKLDVSLIIDEAKSPSNLMEIGVKTVVPTLSISNNLTVAPVTIERLEKNLEGFKDEEVEEMMGNEEYAKKRLQLGSTEKLSKPAKEEFGSAPVSDEPMNFVKSPFSIMSNRKLGDNSLKKFRTGRFFNMKHSQEPILSNPSSLAMNNDDNDELSEPPGVTLPLFSEIGPSSIQSIPKANNTNRVPRNCTPPPIGSNRIIPMSAHNVVPGGHHLPLPMNIAVNSPYPGVLNNPVGINNHIRLNHPVGPTNIPHNTNNPIGSPIPPNIPLVVNAPLVQRSNATTPPSSISPDGTPKKRRGRALSGKGKKTLAAEAAAAAAAAGLPVPEPVAAKISPNKSLGPNIEIASPPQPFSQSQPAPSVITRMLQTSPGKGAFPIGRIRPKQFAMMPDVDNESDGSISVESHGDPAHKDVPPHPPRSTHPPGHYASPVSGQYPSNYYQKEGQVPPHVYHHQRPAQAPIHSYPQHTSQTPIDQSSINPPPLNQPPMNQPPMNQPPMNQPLMNQPPMSQSPMNQPSMTQPTMNKPPMTQLSMNQPPINRPPLNQSPINQSPINQPPINPPPISQTPINLSDSTPPSIGQYSSTSPAPKQSYDPMAHRESYGNTSSGYGYDYNATAPSVMNTDEVLHTTPYDNTAAYPEQYENPVPSLDPNIKSIEDEPGGEFGGLVSYFSSQHEDDLDT